MADVVVAGAAGRMGNRLVALLQEDKELRLVAALEAPGHPALGRDAGEVAGVGRLAVPITADNERRPAAPVPNTCVHSHATTKYSGGLGSLAFQVRNIAPSDSRISWTA